MSISHESLVAEWEDLLAGAREHVVEVPALTPFMTALERALEEVNVSKAHQINLRVRRQQATREYQLRVAAGRELVIRLRSLVKAVFGRHDSRLSDFGIQPGKLRIRRPTEPEN